MISALILDDEMNNTDNLKILLGKYCSHISPVDVAHSATQARTAMHAQQPDLLFLDIQMPVENGFAFLQSLPAATEPAPR